MKDLAAFTFEGSPINEGLVRSLHDGAFLANHRNIVLVGGTGTGKTHLAIAITANVVRAGARGRYFNTVDRHCQRKRTGPAPGRGRRPGWPARNDRPTPSAGLTPRPRSSAWWS